MTQREFFNAIVNGTVTEAEVEFARAQIAKIDERNAKRKGTLTKNQKANVELKAQIVALFEGNKVMTAKAVGEALEVTTQKAGALLRQLVNAGELVSFRAKKTAPLEFQRTQENG